MAAKTKLQPKPHTIDAPKSTDESSPETLKIVVRRGSLRRFDMMKKKSADLPVTVTWDRRVGQRRAAAEAPGQERRASDRRKTPPFTWEMADFVLVEKPEDAASRATTAEPKKTKTARRK
jgi:hypothetical protein